MTRATIAKHLLKPAERVVAVYDAVTDAAELLVARGVDDKPTKVRRALRDTRHAAMADDFRADLVTEELRDLKRDDSLIERHAAAFVLACHVGAALTTFGLTDLWGRGIL